MLAPDTAQNLGLAFHELATNASKYGALSADRASSPSTWSRTDGEVRIRWQEHGGPPVTPPDRRGFGRVLLERLVGATLNGSVTLDFRPEGLVCDIVFPRRPPDRRLTRQPYTVRRLSGPFGRINPRFRVNDSRKCDSTCMDCACVVHELYV